MTRKQRDPAPNKPAGMNGDHAAIWDHMHWQDERSDERFMFLVKLIVSSGLGVTLALVLTVIGALLAMD